MPKLKGTNLRHWKASRFSTTLIRDQGKPTVTTQVYLQKELGKKKLLYKGFKLIPPKEKEKQMISIPRRKKTTLSKLEKSSSKDQSWVEKRELVRLHS